jgi:hypothetical protein
MSDAGLWELVRDRSALPEATFGESALRCASSPRSRHRSRRRSHAAVAPAAVPAAEHLERQITVLVVVAVEEASLLPAVERNGRCATPQFGNRLAQDHARSIP